MSCYGYIRVLQTKNAVEELERLKAWGKDGGFKFKKIVEEVGDSGSLAALIRKLKPGALVVALNISHFGKDRPSMYENIEAIHAKQAYVADVENGIDTRSFDENGEFSKEQSERIMNAIGKIQDAELEPTIKRGPVTGRPPFGWKKVSGEVGSDLVEVPEKQKIIGLVRIMRSRYGDYGQQTSYLEIANQIQAHGFLTPGNGKRWRADTVKGIYCRAKGIFNPGR